MVGARNRGQWPVHAGTVSCAAKPARHAGRQPKMLRECIITVIYPPFSGQLRQWKFVHFALIYEPAQRICNAAARPRGNRIKKDWKEEVAFLKKSSAKKFCSAWDLARSQVKASQKFFAEAALADQARRGIFSNKLPRSWIAFASRALDRPLTLRKQSLRLHTPSAALVIIS